VGSNDPDLHLAALLGLAEARYRMDDEAGALQAWITATQGPETPLTWRAWKALAQSRVRGGDLTGAARAYREAERRAPPSERQEITVRLTSLSRETGDPGSMGSASVATRAAVHAVPAPIMTWIILGITISIGISALVNAQLAVRWLGLFQLDKALVADGELWRLVTVALVHDTRLPIHLALNMLALYMIGPIVEALYGPARFLAIYLVCAAAGSAASYLVSPNDGVGASGAIFGLFGVLLVLLVSDRVHRPALTRNARNLTAQIGGLIAVNLAFGFTVAQIDNAAHVGGLIAGLWLGFVLVPLGARRGWSVPAGDATAAPAGWIDRRVVGLLGVSLAVGAIAVAVLLVGPLQLSG
jgi:membrane associated rhomboid family serine protease